MEERCVPRSVSPLKSPTKGPRRESRLIRQIRKSISLESGQVGSS